MHRERLGFIPVIKWDIYDQLYVWKWKGGGVGGGGLKDLAENHGYIKQKSYKGGCFTHE